MPPAAASFVLSCAVWAAILVIPPGPKTVEAAYRLNFAQGVVCSMLSVVALMGHLPESVAIMACGAYFAVDTVNKLLNDFYYKVDSYQRGVVRIVEYVHHVLSIVTVFYSHMYYREMCSFNANPVLRVALAELSTPFLVAWRETGSDLMGGLFVLVFFLIRIVYQCGFLMPEIMQSCSSAPIQVFSWLYMALNAWFIVMIVKKAVKGVRRSKRPFAGSVDNATEAKSE